MHARHVTRVAVPRQAAARRRIPDKRYRRAIHHEAELIPVASDMGRDVDLKFATLGNEAFGLGTEERHRLGKSQTREQIE